MPPIVPTATDRQFISNTAHSAGATFCRAAVICLILAAVSLLNLGQVKAGAKQEGQGRAKIGEGGGAGHTPAKLRTTSEVAASLARTPLAFEPNQGQTDARVKFLARGAGYTLFLTDEGAVLSLRGGSRGASKGEEQRGGDSGVEHDPSARLLSAVRPGAQQNSGGAVRMSFLGAHRQAPADGLSELPGRSNYFRGSNPARWRSNVVHYAKVRYSEVYPGIDVIYYGNQGQLEYDFVVAPGSDPRQIRLEFAGARRMKVDAAGDLVIETADGQELRLHRPVAYQAGTEAAGPAGAGGSGTRGIVPNAGPVQARYRVRGNRVGIELTGYDPRRELVIDPVLSYATYLGGASNDYGTSIGVDSAGNVIVTGYTTSVDFPTAQPIQGQCGGCASLKADAFISKLDPAGTTLLYSTYLGGADNDYGNGVAVDAAGNAYIVGQTLSTDFPVTSGAFQPTCGNGNCSGGDAFVAKLDATGSTLLYSTYLGGKGVDQGNGIALDGAGDAYVTGFTQSTNFPVTAGVIQGTCSCSSRSDIYLTELNPAGSGLVYSTYLGGTSADVAYAVALDPANNAYVTGYTHSTDFPTTAGAFQKTRNADPAAFVAAINSTATALIYSTYLGGSTTNLTPCEACGASIAVDSGGNAYVGGLTAESNFPTTPGAFQTVFKSSSKGHDAFLTKLNAAGTALVYSTYLGGSGDDGATAIALDADGNLWAKGNTKSTDFPVSTDAFQKASAGDFDAYLAELNSTGTALLYGTYVGGTGTEFSGATRNMMVDGQSPPNVYLTAYTNSTNFPTTAGVVQSHLAGSNDAYIAKFVTVRTVSVTPGSLGFGDQVVGATSAAQTVTLTNIGQGQVQVSGVQIAGSNSGDFAQTNTCSGNIAPQASCTVSVTFTPADTGARSATLSVSDNASGSPQTVALSGNGTAGQTTVTLSPSSLTFDAQLVGTTSPPQQVTLTNQGGQVLNISSITVPADYAQTNTCGASVAAGASCTLSVTFTPSAAGSRNGVLLVNDDGQNSPQALTLAGTGAGGPAVTLSPSSLTFASQLVGTSSVPMTVTLTNSGDQSLSISGVGASGDFSQTNNCGSSVAAGASCTLNVTFTPAAVGTRSGSLSITDNAGGSPQSVPLNGTGAAGAAVMLSPSSLTFPPQLVGTTSSPLTVVLTNTGDLSLSITSFTSSGDFAQSNTCGATVLAGASCTITVTFTPTKSHDRTGSISIADNATGSPQTIKLTGKGTYVTISPASLDFGSVTVGTTSSRTLTLTNAGTATLNITSISLAGANPGRFSQTNTCGSSVSGGASCTITVTFSPNAKGLRTATVQVKDDGGASPQIVNLSGTGS